MVAGGRGAIASKLALKDLLKVSGPKRAKVSQNSPQKAVLIAARSRQIAKIWLQKAPGQDLAQNGPFPNSLPEGF